MAPPSQDGRYDEYGVGRGESDENHVDGRLHLRPAQHHDRYHVADEAQHSEEEEVSRLIIYRAKLDRGLRMGTCITGNLMEFFANYSELGSLYSKKIQIKGLMTPSNEEPTELKDLF